MSVMQRFSLEGKTAVITGGTGIIGSHFTKGLLQAGARVAVFDINDSVSEFSKKLLEEYPERVLGLTCDISRKSDVEKRVAEVVAEWGDIHILHNNAAGKSEDLKAFFAPYEDYSEETWQKIMSVNLNGSRNMSQVVGKHMVERKIKGSIVQTCSIYGVMAPDQRIYEGAEYMGVSINSPAVYTASKAALHGMTKYLATYWARHGIRVNSLTPGGVESGQNDTFVEKYSQRIPMGRMARAEEMVGALIYLASEASSYVTGQNIVIDGGLNAW